MKGWWIGLDKETLQQIADFAAECAGEGAEAVIYSVTESTDPLPEHLRLLLHAAEDGRPHLSYTDKDGVRRSALFLRDGNGVVEYVVCVSRDFLAISRLLSLIGGFIGLNTTEYDVDSERYVRAGIEKLVPGGVEQARRMDSEDRQKLITALNDIGVFQIKKAEEHVINMLKIPPASLYRYKKKKE